jgi:hypothetical protein
VSDHQRGRDDSGDPSPEGGPVKLSPESRQTGQIVRAVQDAVHQGLREVRADLSRVETRAHTDYFRTLGAFALGFVALASMVIQAYRWGHEDLSAASVRLEGRIEKLDDRMVAISSNLTRTDQKLQDLSDRVPPVPTPIPHR